MSETGPDSWEDDLSRQTEGVNLNNNNNAGNFQAQAPSFHPGANTFQPGAASFVPGQQFQQYGQYGYPQYQQYGQQQQGYYPAYGQQQQGYNQGYGILHTSHV